MLSAALLCWGAFDARVEAEPLRAPHYDLTVHLRPADSGMHVTGVLHLPPFATSRSEFRFSLAATARDVRFGGGTTSSRSSGDGNREWTVRPKHPIARGQTARISFELDDGGVAAPLYYVGPEIALASAWGTNWYPIVVDGAVKAVGTIRVVCPDGWSAVAGDHPLATSAGSAGTFAFQIDHPTYFSFVAGPFSVVRQAGSPPLAAYVLESHEHLPALMAGSAKLLNVQQDEFGPFPFRSFALVEVPRDIANKAGFNAASLPGFIWVNSNAFNAPKIDYLLEWLGHEFTHQWFPQEVAFRTPPGLYMEEAIAEFGGWHAVAVLGGDAAAERLRRSGFEYDPIYSAAAYFKLVNAGFDRALRDLRNTADDRNVAYNKGAFVFYMLSQTLGEERFRNALHAVTARYAFQTIEWDRFLRAVAENSGQDLDWFYDQWFRRTGAPEFNLSWHQDNGRLVGTIVQKAPFYRATLDVKVAGSDGETVVTRVDVSAKDSNEFSLPITFEVKSVLLDPSYKVLRWTPDYKAGASPAPQSTAA